MNKKKRKIITVNKDYLSNDSILGCSIFIDISQPFVINGNYLRAFMTHGPESGIEKYINEYNWRLTDKEILEFKDQLENYKNAQKFDNKIKDIINE